MSPPRAVGRPRLHAPADEQRLLLDAAYQALRERGAQALTVSDVLRIAGLSTRAFYRHFDSKDELLEAVYRREARSAARRLRLRVEAAAPGRDQVVVWIDEILRMTASRSLAQRVAVLGSLPARIIDAASQQARAATNDLVSPLEDAIARGVADGTLRSTQVVADARMIAAVTYDVAGLGRTGAQGPARPVTRDQLVRFALAALGALPSDERDIPADQR